MAALGCPATLFTWRVAFVVTLPILVHNVRHDFAPLLYQWKHSMAARSAG